MSVQNSTVTIALSTKGLRNIPFSQYENDFRFLVGDSEYRCPSFVADFLSPRIASAHSADITIDSFELHISSSERVFETFLSVGRGCSVTLTESNLGLFRSICIELGNQELLDVLFEQLEGDLNVKNAIDRLLLFEGNCEIGSSSDNNRSRSLFSAIDLIASQLSEFCDSELSRLGFDLLREVLSQDSLRLKSEDWLICY
jgi:hypothetical protein